MHRLFACSAVTVVFSFNTVGIIRPFFLLRRCYPAMRFCVSGTS